MFQCSVKYITRLIILRWLRRTNENSFSRQLKKISEKDTIVFCDICYLIILHRLGNSFKLCDMF